jgi:hypothetical protein
MNHDNANRNTILRRISVESPAIRVIAIPRRKSFYPVRRPKDFTKARGQLSLWSLVVENLKGSPDGITRALSQDEYLVNF